VSNLFGRRATLQAFTQYAGRIGQADKWASGHLDNKNFIYAAYKQLFYDILAGLPSFARDKKERDENGPARQCWSAFLHFIAFLLTILLT
jgi:hypothetical protein